MRCALCHRRLSPGAACRMHGGGRAQAAGEFPPVPEIEGLVPGALLGRGGFASVWEASDTDGRIVAVKVGQPDAAPRFRREALALAAVGPGCAPGFLRALAGARGEPVLVMERLYGTTLAELMAALPGTGALPLARLPALAAGLARLVDHMHAAGIVHRDLKPENVFVEAGERPRLIDFGLASQPVDGPRAPTASALTRSGANLGTPGYMAPEQAAGHAVGPAADRYALGVILYELCAGRLPFVGTPDELRRAHALVRPPLVDALATLPRAAFQALERFLAKSPAERWPSAARGVDAFCDGLERGIEPGPRATAAVAVLPARAALRSVGLVGVRSSLALTVVAELAADRGGLVARVRDDGVLVLFAGVAAPRVVEQADAFAAAVGASAGEASRTLVHAAEVLVREGPRGLSARGAALDEPAWWSAKGPSGQHRTEPAAACLPPPPPVASAFVSSPALSPLCGRQPLLAALHAEALRVRAQRLPAVTTIIGAAGTGKTRLLQALAGELGAGWRVLGPQASLGASAGAARGRHGQAAALAASLVEPAARGPVAWLVDDAHLSTPAQLDGLELALVSAELPVWICVAAQPALLERRAALGEASGRAVSYQLGPLLRADADELVRQRLAPVEHVTAEDLERLWRRTRGLPQAIVEVTDALRRIGAIRRHPRAAGYYLAADDLLDDTATPLSARLAHRLLAPLPETLRRFAELAASLGSSFATSDVEAAQHELGRHHAEAELDAHVALARLCEAGLLEGEGDGRHRFASPMLREAIETITPPAARGDHRRAAAAVLRPGDDQDVARLARLAADEGDAEAAAELYERLGDRARTGQRIADAERAYAAALRSAPVGDDGRRGRLLAQRGRMRYRVHRSADAHEDLQAAVEIALARGERARAAELYLELATVADWSDRFTEAEQLLARAETLAAGSPPPVLRARLALARARAAYRRQELVVAAQGLREAATRAESAGDDETRLVALLLAGAVLVSTDELAEAERVLDLAVDLGEAAGDRLHLCSALNNREWLWLRRGDLDRALADSRRATSLSRELGHAPMERATLSNQAELLLWRGEPALAVPLARRARQLAEQHLSEVPYDALLEARIHLALRDRAAARAAADVARARAGPQPAPVVRLQLKLLDLALARATSASQWRELVDEACQAKVLFEAHEVIWLAAEAACARGEPDEAVALCERGVVLSVDAPSWAFRFSSRRDRLTEQTL